MSFVSTKLMGGLGNYLFQISTAYYLCLRDNKELLCDVSDSKVPHKPYSNYTSNIFRNVNFINGVTDFTPLGEGGFSYFPLPQIDGNVKLYGYFQSEKYFMDYRNEILELFKIDGETNQKLINKYGEVLKRDTCSIHVRRGDYLGLQNYHPIQPIEYYQKAINIIGKENHFLIFSDDIKWCEENFSFLKNKTFVSDNLDYEDLYLMSMCNNNILANSTFSWWGAWLNNNENKQVIIPSKWFGVSNSHLNTNDLYCNKWIKL
jgi:hypothetical protein